MSEYVKGLVSIQCPFCGEQTEGEIECGRWYKPTYCKEPDGTFECWIRCRKCTSVIPPADETTEAVARYKKLREMIK